MFRSSRGLTALVLVLGLAGCGLQGADKEAAEQLARAFPAEYTGLSTDEGECVAEHWVKEIGRSSLKDAGLFGDNDTLIGNVRDAQLDEEDAEKAYAAFDDCTDAETLVTGMVTELFDADDAQRECIHETVTGDNVRAWVTSDLQGKVTDNIYVLAGKNCMSTPDQDEAAVATLAGSLGKRDGMTTAQAQCVAEQLVERIGTYELTAAGILDEDQRLVDDLQGSQLNETDANLAADATASCVTMEEMLTRTLAGGGKSGTAAKVKTCFTAAFDDEAFHQYLVNAYSGRQETGLDDAATKGLADCLAAVLEDQNTD
ncbi:MAG TPA: hypothetical protein VLI04_10460 [Nocardioidaceae bacterium]|nr:hypothetical protein [Nocardioidaceae bacterium]